MGKTRAEKVLYFEALRVFNWPVTSSPESRRRVKSSAHNHHHVVNNCATEPLLTWQSPDTLLECVSGGDMFYCNVAIACSKFSMRTLSFSWLPPPPAL